MVLGHSLKDRGAKAKLVAFILVDKLAATTVTDLKVRISVKMKLLLLTMEDHI
jgi:hypothetical protein